MISKIKDMDSVKELFQGWEETMIWSCLQGIMGEIYADVNKDLGKPQSAMAVLGDFCFLAGKANADLVKYKPRRCDSGESLSESETGHSDMTIMVPQNQQWAELIEDAYKNAARKTERYAIKKEADVFGKEHLKQIVENLNKVSCPNKAAHYGQALPQNEALYHDTAYALRSIDESLYQQCKERTWSRDLVSQFSSYDMYSRYGLGFVILKNGEIVSGASSYSAYRQGIEIEIDTREDHRRQGLALVCGARLVLECLDRGLYPSWDAQNKASVALAEKLGYHYSHAYTAYEVME